MEHEVLYKLSDEIYRKIKYILLEIHSQEGYSKDDLINFLKNKKFNILQSTENKKVFIAKNKNYNN